MLCTAQTIEESIRPTHPVHFHRFLLKHFDHAPGLAVCCCWVVGIVRQERQYTAVQGRSHQRLQMTVWVAPPPLTCHMRSFPSDSSRDPERQRLRPAAHVRCASEEMHAHHATHRFFNQSLTCASVIRPAPVKHAKNVAATWRQGRSTLGKWSESFAVDDAAAAGRSVIDGGDESTAPGPLLLPGAKINHHLRSWGFIIKDLKKTTRFLVVETYHLHR